MNEKYLWDRTGEPDPQIRQLEELLGELRYQPQPLEIPKTFSARRRSFTTGLAIAATLLVALAIGLWLNLNRRSANQTPERQARDSRSEQQVIPPPPSSATENQALAIQNTEKPRQSERHQRVARSFIAIKHQRSTIQPALTTEELAQKEQVVFALRMVSAKLNLAQRKTLVVPQANIIRNQHKVG